mgnify:CR=1 FL=1
MIDYLIKNGTVIDGTGRKEIVKEIAISEGKIVSFRSNIKSKAIQEINAQGKVVCPGFIDIHSHSDFTLLVNRNAESAIHQGITTMVTGNCGHGPAPCIDKDLAKQVTIGYSDSWETDISWNSFGEYVENLFSPGLAVNVAPLVPHGSIRMAVMGYDGRKPSKLELDEMKLMVSEAMSAGAAGFSTGLEYSPGKYAEIEEIIALTSVAANHGGIYASHIRNRADNFLTAVEEALTISKPYLERKESQGYAHRLVGDLLRYNNKEQEAQKILQAGLVQFPGNLFLVDGLSASLVITQDWKQLIDLLETTLEQNQRLLGNPPMHLLFLNRLVVAYQRENKKKKKLEVLRKFHQKNDPLTASKLHSLEEQLLFPISLPSLDKELSSSLIP